MQTRPSIHLTRGSVAHLVLEHIFTVQPDVLGKHYRKDLLIIASELLKKYWREHKKEFDSLDLTELEILEFYKETDAMIANWINQHCNKIDKEIATGLSIPDAFRKLTPQTEIEYRSDDLMVRGYIDVIETSNGITRLMDHKTSKRAHITDAYKLQLGIYALLYELKHSKRPDKVGIYFLRDTEHILDVDDDLVENARFMIEQIHMSTDGSDDIVDYPKKPTPLCKWSSGQCDFYDYCFKGKKIPDKPVKRIYKKSF